MKLLCRVGLHKWHDYYVHLTDRYRESVCVRCKLTKKGHYT